MSLWAPTQPQPSPIWALASSILIAAILSFPIVASSQTLQDDPFAGVEEMIVVGSGAAVLLDSLGAGSVTGFDSDSLSALGAADISDLAAFTPNLEIVTAGNSSPTFFIRGIGLNDFAATATGAISIVEDGVPKNSPALQLSSFFDTEGVSVLRGPQGSGAYRNASAGAIRVDSRRPTGNYGGSAEIQIGNFNSRDYQVALEAPIVDEVLSLRLAGKFFRRDGYAENLCGNQPLDGRVPRPLGQSANDPPFSLCGESVPQFSVSEISPNLPTNVNNGRNWGARAMFRFTPEISRSISMDMLLGLRGARRDELSNVGQAIGTNGIQRVPPVTDNSNNIVGILGGSDAGEYIDADILAVADPARSRSLDFCQPSCTPAQRLGAINAVNLRLADSLARNLDRDPQRGAYNRVGDTRNTTYGATLNTSFEFSDLGIDVRLISGYDEYDREIDVDLDFTPNVLFEQVTEDSGWQIYEELRVSGESLGDANLSWSIGGYYFQEEVTVEVDAFSELPLVGVGLRDYDQEIQSTAVYAEGSWNFLEPFVLDFGLRYNWERRSIDYRLVRTAVFDFFADDRDTYSEPTGLLKLTYNPTESVSIYGSYTHGWKSGSYNATGNIRQGINETDPEVVDAWEFGVNASLWEDRITLLLSLFYYDYADYQLFTVANNANANPEFVVINASDVEVFGTEVEFNVRPWDLGFLDVKFGWLESAFIDYVQFQTIVQQQGAQSVFLQTEIDNSGNRLLNSPRFTVNLTLSQGLDLGEFGIFELRWDGAWKDDSNFDASEGRGLPNPNGQIFLPENTIGQRAFWLHSMRLSWKLPGNNIELAVWGRNITNEGYKVFSFDATSFQSTTVHFIGEPRTYGGTLKLTF